jgi:hypothetical protein
LATYAEDYSITEPSRAITVEMIRPRAQVSTYIDNTGKPSQMSPGIQQPIRPVKTPPPAPAVQPNSTPPPAESTSTTGSKPQ